MMKAISDIHQKATAIADKVQKVTKSYLVIGVCLGLVAIFAIPVLSHTWDYWKPVLTAWKVVGPEKVKGRL